jgi:cysteinyl-tRNA synthetase
MTLRLFTLQAHYRKPLDFTAEALEAAATGWKGLNAALGLTAAGCSTEITPAQGASDPAALPPDLAAARSRFAATMDDDLNTSAALAVLFELARPLRALANRLERGDAAAEAEAADPALTARGRLLRELAAVLGLKPEPRQLIAASTEAGAGGSAGAESPSAAEIEALIEQRRTAKAQRDFARADGIRDQLRNQGIELIDKPGGICEWLRTNTNTGQSAAS